MLVSKTLLIRPVEEIIVIQVRTVHYKDISTKSGCIIVWEPAMETSHMLKTSVTR
jgi:hypothetical protein